MGLSENFKLRVQRVIEAPPRPIARASAHMNHISGYFNGVARQTFSNGLGLVQHDDKSAPNVSMSVTVRAGASHEPGDKKGLAHFVEHMMFQSPHIQDMAEEFTRRGGWMNAKTGDNLTVYDFRIPKGYDNERLMMSLSSQMLLDPQFDHGELLEEQEVVKNEARMYGDLETLPMDSLLIQKAFGVESGPNNSNAERLLGTESDIDRITVHDLGYFHYQHYHPSNMSVELSGSLSHKNFRKRQAIFGMVGESFGSYDRPLPPEIREKPLEYEGGHGHLPDSKDLLQTHVNAAFDMTGQDGRVLGQAQDVLRMYMNLALKDRLRGKTDRKVYAAAVGNMHYHGKTLLVMSTNINPENMDRVMPVFSRILADLASGDIDENLFEQAVNQVRTIRNEGRHAQPQTPLERISERFKDWVYGRVEPRHLSQLVNERMLANPPTLVTAGPLKANRSRVVDGQTIEETVSLPSYEEFQRMLPVPQVSPVLRVVPEDRKAGQFSASPAPAT